jgi:hypothetical protein
MRIIACIEDRQVINQILAHINKLNQQQVPFAAVMAGRGIRAPPTVSKFLMNH